MLESEKSSLAGRVHDLERRVITQQDEIVCLRSTLADVLRRVNLLEGMGNERQQGSGAGGRSGSLPGTPARTNSISSSRASPTPQPQQQTLGHTFSNGSYSSSSLSNTYNGNEVIRLRKPQPRPMSSSSSPSGAKGNSIEAMLRRNTMGSSGALSSMTNRSRTSHHQSNGSLHSDTQSSSSVSPAPSPSPRQTPSQSAAAAAAASTVGLGKRWSSTGDFNTNSPLTNRYEEIGFSESILVTYLCPFVGVFTN